MPGDGPGIDSLVHLAQEAQARGEFAVAEEHWRQALALGPLEPKLLNGLGTARQLQRDLEGALSAYATALSFSPEYAPALSNSGAALQALGRFREALALYDRAIRQSPQNLTFWRNKLSCLLFLPDTTPEVAYEASREFARNFTPSLVLLC